MKSPIAYQLVIKFRDNVELYDSFIKDYTSIEDSQLYLDASNDFSVLAENSTNKIQDSVIYSKLEIVLKDFIVNGFKLNYVFDQHPIDIFLNLFEWFQKENSQGGSVTPLSDNLFPNFYNYFTIVLSHEDFNDEQTCRKFLFEKLYSLSFLQLEEQEENFRIFDFFYIKGENELTAPVAGSNQYHADLGIINNTGNRTPIKVFDIECAWNPKDSEIDDTGIPLSPIFPMDYSELITQLPSPYIRERKAHGTSVLGILKAERNSNFTKGIAPNANINMSSIFGLRQDRVVNSVENAILATLYEKNENTIIRTEKGSIILLEIYMPPYPIEIEPAVWQLIQIATRLGLIVIEAAGNKEYDLADLPQPYGRNLANLERRYNEAMDKYEADTGESMSLVFGFADNNQIINNFLSNNSGAILVGAYSKNSRNQFYRTANTTYDTRPNKKIKVYGQGENVSVVINEREEDFGFTSAASAIIAGLAALIQAYARDKGKYIPADKMLTILSLPGHNVYIYVNGALTRIGNVPNYNRAKRWIDRNLDLLTLFN